MEQLLQKEREKSATLQSFQNNEEQIKKMMIDMDNLVLQQESMQLALSEKVRL